jgi:hypothetical protein
MTSILKIIFSNEDDFDNRNINLKLKRIDDDFYVENKIGIEKEFNNISGNIEIKLPKEGKYLLEMKINLTKKILGLFNKNISNNYRDIIEVKGEEELKMDLKKFNEKDVQDEEIDRVYEEERSDKNNCYICKNRFKAFSDKYKCVYCKKNFCSKHRLPEEHKCTGKLLNPKGMFLKENIEKAITVVSLLSIVLGIVIGYPALTGNLIAESVNGSVPVGSALFLLGLLGVFLANKK